MNNTDGSGRTGSFRPVLGASVFLFLTVLGIAGVKSSHDLESARQRKLMLETRIRSTESEIDRLRNRIARLRTDPGLLERHAREDLGMVRPGDVVIELPIEGSERAAPPPVQTARASTGPAAPAAIPAATPPLPVPDPLAHR